tara:strand:+ start:1560 stop:3008 length:1449 start_codon:yes stop_codon:yes gene_type:complete
MPAKQNKKFLKRYSSTIKNAGTSGQGHTIGIPTLGAVDGSGDGSKYLGRLPRPRYSGDQGSPSQSADSGFSSFLSRVNKNIELPEDEPMFPSQEKDYYDDLVNIYKAYDVEPLVTSKLKKSAPTRVSRFRESSSITESLDISPLDFSNTIGDAFRQMASGFDGIDWVVLLPSLLKNYAEIKFGVRIATKAKENYYENPDYNNTNDLSEAANSLAIDVLDIVQILGELIIPSLGGTAFSLKVDDAISKIPMLKTAMHGGGMFGDTVRGMSQRSALRDLSQELKPIFDSLPGPVRKVFDVFLESINLMAEIEDVLEERQGYSRTASSLYGGDEEDWEDKISRWPDYIQRYATEFLGDFVTKPFTKIFALSENNSVIDIKKEVMKKEDLRLLVRKALQEYVIDQPDSLHPPFPDGYLFRDIPNIENEQGDMLDIIRGKTQSDKAYDKYAVIVPGDEGVSTYSARPTNESELRSMIKDILAESKKK